MKHTRTDLTLSSGTTTVTFYSPSWETYESAVIMTVNAIPSGSVGWRQYSKGDGNTLNYFLTHPGLTYEGLEETLDETHTGYFTLMLGHEMPEPGKCTALVSPKDVATSILSSEHVIFTFGAGISAGYVPTLIEFFNRLGLKKETSCDRATVESMDRFVDNLLRDPDTYFAIVTKVWGSVRSPIASTPAHRALSTILHCLPNTKSRSVFTDNIDGIHSRAGITLSRKPHFDEAGREDYETLTYPSKAELKGKKVVVVCIGQSFDFDNILATIDNNAQEVEYISMNISDNTINIRLGVDMLSLHESIEMGLISEENAAKQYYELDIASLNMSLLPGSCHETVPALCTELLRQRAEAIPCSARLYREYRLAYNKRESEADFECSFTSQYKHALKRQSIRRDPSTISRIVDEEALRLTMAPAL